MVAEASDSATCVAPTDVAVQVAWVSGLDDVGWDGSLVRLLDPGTPERRSRWGSVLSGTTVGLPAVDVYLMHRGPTALELERAVARLLGTVHIVAQDVVHQTRPDARVAFVIPASEVTDPAIDEAAEVADGRSWGVFTGADDAATVFLAAKARLHPARTRRSVLDGSSPESPNEEQGAVILRGHGDGQHIKLGQTVLCGEFRSEEVLDSGVPVGGCGLDRCRRVRTPEFRRLRACDIRADTLLLVSCRSLNMAGGAFPSTNSIVTGAVDGWARTTLAFPEIVVVPDRAVAHLLAAPSLSGAVVAAEVGATPVIVGLPPVSLLQRLPARPRTDTRLSEDLGVAAAPTRHAIAGLAAVELAYRRHHPNRALARQLLSRRLEIEEEAQLAASTSLWPALREAHALASEGLEAVVRHASRSVGVFGWARVGVRRRMVRSDGWCEGCGARCILQVVDAPLLPALRPRVYRWCRACGPITEGPVSGATLELRVTVAPGSVDVTVTTESATPVGTDLVVVRIWDKGKRNDDRFTTRPITDGGLIRVGWPVEDGTCDQHAVQAVWLSSMGVTVAHREVAVFTGAASVDPPEG